MADSEKGKGIMDSIVKGIGEAVTDIRQKVVEEGMWGRQVTPDAPAESPYAEQGLPPSFEEYRASKDAPEKEPAQAKEQDKGRDLEIGE